MHVVILRHNYNQNSEMKIQTIYRLLTVVVMALSVQVIIAQTSIQGLVMDKKYNEPLTGAAILIEGTTNGTTADIDGKFNLTVGAGTYTLVVSYVSYNTQRIPNVRVEAGKPTIVNINMEEASLVLESVQVVAQLRSDTELSLMRGVRSAVQVVSGVSSQQISKTLDGNAAEVVRRVPGITIQDNRFIVVRGLNQRYNNVWLNNAATPSSETDVKAFSFDAIPSNMIDNLMIYKTASPELSAEATGGFIKISTKNIPDENFLHVEYGFGYNDVTTFKDTYQLPGKPLDFLALGAGARNIPTGFPANFNRVSAVERDRLALQLDNKWVAQQYTALPNQKFSFAFGKKWNLDAGARIGTITSLTYNNAYSTRENALNYQYEAYNFANNTPTYKSKYIADTYSKEFRLGLMHNWAYQNASGTKIEFKNILNQTGVDRTANNKGYNNNRQGNFEYYSNQYSSRTTYSGQLSGDHKLNNSDDTKLDWNIGYAYANRIEPNRQNWSKKENSVGKYDFMIPSVPSINELGRLYMANHEHVAIAALNFQTKFDLLNTKATLKTGFYNELKDRNFSERSLTYRKETFGPFTDEFLNTLDFETLFTETYLGAGKALTIDEQTDVANAYTASSLLNAAYAGLHLPYGMLNLNAGVRAELYNFKLNGYYNISSPVARNESFINIFPSLNTSYNLNDKSLLRLAFASTINRPEFREKSPFSYYDFEGRFSVRGNPDLLNAHIQNVDLRYEYYPTPNETFSFAAFYKYFSNPIEMVSAGTDEYTFDNALSAQNYGVELELKKSLESWVGIKNLVLSVNASFIFSDVQFADVLNERSRPLQGQSPYVVNAALFYQNDKLGLLSSLMYNIMGKRIMVAAELNQGNVVIPDIYEMERHVVDFSLNKKLGKNLELKFGIKDLLAQDFRTQQTFENINGSGESVDLVNRLYNSGRTYSLSAVWKF